MMRGTVERPEGLELCLEAIDEDMELAAIEEISSYDLQPMVIHANPSRRLVAHFGVTYDPALRAVVGTAIPVPPVLGEVVATAAATLGAQDLDFQELLATRYPPGSGIGTHRPSGSCSESAC